MKIIFIKPNLCSTCDDYIRDFEDETVEVCDVIMACLEDMTPEDAYKHKYRYASMQVIDEHTNTDEYEYVALFYLL
jgi:hypothetical protein